LKNYPENTPFSQLPHANEVVPDCKTMSSVKELNRIEELQSAGTRNGHLMQLPEHSRAD